MKPKIDAILDECLAQLRAGVSAEDCLARYPEHAEALRPMLALARQVQSLPAPAPDRAAMNAGRQRMIEAVRARAARQEQARLVGLPWLKRPRPVAGATFGRPVARALASLALVLLLVVLSAGGLVAAAKGSLPGDTLYPLKRTAEDVRMSLTSDPMAQQQLQRQFDRERQQEVHAVLAAGRPASLEFRGILEFLDTDHWIVAGLRVRLDDRSLVEGQPVVGASVVVHADSLGDGTLLATRLQVETTPLLPSPTPTPTTSPTPPPPTASPTPAPTRQAAPTPSHTATATPPFRPTDPPPPMHTREPESTDHPQPGETEEPEATDHPEVGETEEPEATDHPEHGETEEPEATHQPQSTGTGEPEPTHHPQPSATEDDHDDGHGTPSPAGTPPAPDATPTEES